MERRDKYVYGILGALAFGTLLYLLVLGLTGTIDLIGGLVSAAGWNLVDGIHVHKSFFGYLALVAGLYLFITYDCTKERYLMWAGLFLVLVGAIIVSFDYAMFGVVLPIDLV